MEMEATQAIPLSDFDDDETDEETEQEKAPVGFLKVLLRKGYPEKQFPVYEGYNLIGRDAVCNIQIDLKALSKQHAYIEVKSGQHFVVDNKSKNKTRRNKIYLVPEARYEVCDGDHLTFADVECVYTKSDGSRKEEKNGREQTTLVDDSFEEEKSEPSSDLLQPTQKFPGHLEPIKNDTGFAGSSKFMYASDSEESESDITGKPFSGQETLVAETPMVSKVKAGVNETSVPDSQAADTTDAGEEPTETVIYDEACEESEEDESDSELRRRIALEPTQAYGNVVEDSDETTDEEQGDSVGFTPTETTMSSKKSSHVLKEEKGKGKATKGKGNLSSTVKYSMDIESTQVADEMTSGKYTDKPAKTLAYDMDVSAETQTGPNSKEDSEETKLDDDTVETDATDSQTMPTQTFSLESGKNNGTQKESAEKIPEVGQINLGFGATMAYEPEESSSDEDYVIPPVRKKFKEDGSSEEAGEMETQVFAGGGEQDMATVAATEDDATQSFGERNPNKLNKTADAEEATQCIETVAVDALNQDAKSSEAPTQDIGGDENEAPTQIVSEVISPDRGNKRTRHSHMEKKDMDVLDSDAPTQAVDENAETQVFETLEVPTEKAGQRKSVSPVHESIQETLVIQNDLPDGGKTNRVDRGRGRGKGRGTARGRGKIDTRSNVVVGRGNSKRPKEDESAEFETQQLQETSDIDKFMEKCDDASTATQMLDEPETQEIVVDSKKMIRAVTGRFSPHQNENFETLDETQVFDQVKANQEVVLNVGAVTSVASKVARESFDSNMAATQKFDEPATPQIFLQKAPHVVKKPKNTDTLATQLFDEDAATQVFVEGDASTQSSSGDKSVEMDSDGFVKPKLPATSTSKFQTATRVTDDLCTQVYEAETDEETDSDDDTDKMNNNENAVSTGNKKGVTDSSEGQGQREEMRKSAATMEVQNTDMLATQVFGDELPDKRHGDEMTDNMETQAYVLEEEEELPDLQMELSVAEASSSKAVQKKPSPARRTGKEKVTEEIVESSQAEHDKEPVSCIPILTVTSPGARGSKRKLEDEAESSMKKQKREPSKEINETLTTKGKRGRKSKNLPKDEEVIVTTELLTVEPNVKGKVQRGRRSVQGVKQKAESPTMSNKSDTNDQAENGTVKRQSRRSKEASPALSATSEGSATSASKRNARKSREPSPALSSTSEDLSQNSNSRKRRSKEPSPALSSTSEELSQTSKRRSGKAVVAAKDDRSSLSSGRQRKSGKGARKDEDMAVVDISTVKKEAGTIIDEGIEGQAGKGRGRGRGKSTENARSLSKGRGRGKRGKAVSPSPSETDSETSRSKTGREKVGRGRAPLNTPSETESETNRNETGGGRVQSGRPSSHAPSETGSENSENVRSLSTGRVRGKRGKAASSAQSETECETIKNLTGEVRNDGGKASSPATSAVENETGKGRGRRGKTSFSAPSETETASPLPIETGKGKRGRISHNTLIDKDCEIAKTVEKKTSLVPSETEMGKGKGKRRKETSPVPIENKTNIGKDEKEKDTASENGFKTGKGKGRRVKTSSSVPNEAATSVTENELISQVDSLSQTESESDKTKSRRGRKKQSDVVDEEPVSKKSRQSVVEEKSKPPVQQNDGELTTERATRGLVRSIKEEPKDVEKDDSMQVEKGTETLKKGGRKGRTKKSLEVDEAASNTELRKKGLGRSSDSEALSPGAEKKRGRPSRGSVPESKPIKKEKDEPSADTSSEGGKDSTPRGKSTSATPKMPRNSQTSAQSQTPVIQTARRRTLERKPRIMFTGVVDEEGQKIVKSLGGELVDSISDCTHLVTDKVRRTVKFLCGVACGLYIVNITWLERCQDAQMFIDAKPFLVNDRTAEKTHKFSLTSSLEKALSNGGMLVGYKVHVTKNVKPPPDMMKDIVTSAGGEFLSSMPKKVVGEAGKTLVISCDEDLSLCKAAQNQGIAVVGAEFILTGILRQEASIDEHQLKTSQPSGKAARSSSKKR